jgi:hypothetical protein
MLLSAKVKGIHSCRWCEEDDTIQANTTYEGHAAIVRHLVLSLKSCDWAINGCKPSRNGMHTEKAKQRRQVPSSDFGSLDMSNPVCPYPDCQKSWEKISRRGYNQHVASKHKESSIVQDLGQEAALENIKQYMKKYHNVEFSKAQFDMVLLHDNEKKRKVTSSSSS